MPGMEQLQPDDDPDIQEFLNEFGRQRAPPTWRSGRVGPANDREVPYVSEKTLRTKLDVGRVQKLLNALYKTWEKPTPKADFIRKHCLRTFAILLTIGHGRMIYVFAKHPNLQDQHLPYLKEPLNFPTSTHVNLFSRFYEAQWAFCVQTMRYDMGYRISQDTILPILAMNAVYEEGGSATMYKIQVDEDCNELQPADDFDRQTNHRHRHTFALKTYRTDDARKYYETESDAFKHLRFNNRPPQNIIAFYGGFERDNMYNIILEYADGGTLEDFIARTPSPPNAEQLWVFWNQFFNVLNGLATIHGERSEDGNGSMLLGTDSNVENSTLQVKQDVDIWSIGCVISEVVTWGSQGWDKVVDYRRRRSEELFRLSGRREDCFHNDGAGLLQTVRDVHDEDVARCPLHDELTEPIIDRLVNEMLISTDEHRPNAKQLYKKSKRTIKRVYGISDDVTPRPSPYLSPQSPPPRRPPPGYGRKSSGSKHHLQPEGSSQMRDSMTSLDITGEMSRDRRSSFHNVQSNLNNYYRREYSESEQQSPSSPDGGTYFVQQPVYTVPNEYRQAQVARPSWRADTRDTFSTDYSSSLSGRTLSATSETTTYIAQRAEDWTPPPELTVEDGLHTVRDNISCPDDDLMEQVRGRDHAFIIDNSTSSRIFKVQMARVLEVLAKKLENAGCERLDLYSLAPYKKLKRLNATTILSHFNSMDVRDMPDIRSGLATIFDDYQKKLGVIRPVGFVKHPRTQPIVGCRKLSLYILTDGNWRPGVNLLREIGTLADHLAEKKLTNTQVGIQFIRFGQSAQAIEKMKRLDSGADFKLNLVDATPANGNVWKMLLGSIDSWFDAADGFDNSDSAFKPEKYVQNVETFSSRYLITWQLQEYYQQDCKGYGTLNDVLILFGDEMNARCLTCEEYCKYKIPEFSDISKGILEIINFAATITGSGEHRTTFHPFPGTWIEFLVKVFDKKSTEESMKDLDSLSNTTVHLSITTNLSSLLDTGIDSLLVSLAAALRPITDHGLAISKAQMQRVSDAIKISLLPLHIVTRKACWHPLFPQKAIFRETLAREKDFVGLQISFNLMIALCGTDIAMLEQGGLCLEGVYTSLIPIKTKERRHMQWHLICVDQDKRESVDFRRELWSVQMPKNWYKTDDLENLQGGPNTMHYIGWCGTCAITVGTLIQNGFRVEESTAPLRKVERIHSSTAFTANALIHGVGISLSRITTQASSARSPFENRERSFTHWLTGSMSEQVLLYAPSKQQAWMVSKTSILLQLVREHIKCVSEADRTLRFNLPDCADESATPLNAYSLLKEHLGTELPVLGAQRPFTIENLLLVFLHLLDKLSRRRTAASWSQKFCGFELADVIHQPRDFQLKKADISHIPIGSRGGWTKLIDKITLVFFFEGLEDPILPSPRPGELREGTICCCSRMPMKKNFLAATLSSLRTLTKDFEHLETGRLTETTFWHSPNPTHLFRNCECDDNTRNEGRLQAIWPGKTAQRPEIGEIEQHPNGAVIFASGLGIFDRIAQ
ncbi:uncharacterized protein KY384_004498 [Bacidia gigantensis]|uniref:uncharacterized protein n=1 Tax=Bacidia gigantensis TaxID=2732470 RepID=UPI001D03DD8D|nr:uncharacterized protein KY384_004498 [Bacidia gigantensis]KAG8531140.1 hypothetical protein KY384_004498 [Bacidia gigantensis]